MRERLSCVVELRRFGVWRCAVTVVAAAAIAAMAAWGGRALATGSNGSVLIATIAAPTAALSALLAASLMRVEPGTLAWADGCWTFTCRPRGVDRIESGTLAVAIDLGSFLLLTLTRSDASRWSSRRWLPVQRRGLEPAGHALRCAVYSPPPVAPEAAAANQPLTE
jgi:hypothetical protein